MSTIQCTVPFSVHAPVHVKSTILSDVYFPVLSDPISILPGSVLFFFPVTSRFCFMFHVTFVFASILCHALPCSVQFLSCPPVNICTYLFVPLPCHSCSWFTFTFFSLCLSTLAFTFVPVMLFPQRSLLFLMHSLFMPQFQFMIQYLFLIYIICIFWVL